MRRFRHLLDWFLRVTNLQYWPVRVRSGLAEGARWTIYPWSAYWRGGYEPEMQQALLDLGDMSGWCCWDLGAHYGLYSVGFARRVGPQGMVAAFEPNPLSFLRLVRHQRMNGLDWLKTFPAAASNQTGESEFYTYGNLESTTTHLPYTNEQPGADTRPIRVALLRLDDLAAKGRIRPPDMIKVDVEGHAQQALSGAIKTIRLTKPIIIAAMHSNGEFHGCMQLLSPLGYQVHRLETSSESPDAVIGHDLFFHIPMRHSILPRAALLTQLRVGIDGQSISIQ